MYRLEKHTNSQRNCLEMKVWICLITISRVVNMQCCEQRAELKNEYEKNRSETTLKQLTKANRNSVQIYNKIIKLYDEKEKEAC